MSGAKTTTQALGGIAVTLLNLALQISGYQSPLVAFALAVIAFFLLLPWLNAQRKIVLKAGKQMYAEYGKAMLTTVLVSALFGAILFGGVAWWGWKMFAQKALLTEDGAVITTKQGTARTMKSAGPSAPPPLKHANTFTPLEIHAQLEAAGPLERDEVAEQFRHGMVDWTLIFHGDIIRPKGADLMTVRFYPVNSPYPKIQCPGIKVEGNAYLGRIRSPTRFRVRGVIGDIDLNWFTLHEATFEQLSDASPVPVPAQSQTPVPFINSEVVPPRTPTPPESHPRAMETVPPRADTKILAGETLDPVFEIFKGRTAFNVSVLLERYEGRTVELTGKIAQLLPGGGNVMAIIQRVPNDEVLVCQFNKTWTEKMRTLDIGESVKIRGEIAGRQSGQNLQLLECEPL